MCRRSGPSTTSTSRHGCCWCPRSSRKAFGRVVIEAGLHSVPALVSDRGGLPETIGAGGFAIDPTDWRAWRDAIKALDDPDAYHQHAQAARTNARKYLRPVVRELSEADVLRPEQSPSLVQPDPEG
ncbi:MAG: glycosyltransferase [Micromonosporaceae bacterium]